MSDKRKLLIARKEKLLQDIQYYDKRIADFHTNRRAISIFEDNDSSDSDTDLPTIDNGPSVTHLKLQQSQLKTSLQATQELTNLVLLESEVNIMVEDPQVVDEPAVSSPGVWREVLAECRLDLVPFALHFHVHTPSIKFGARSYRNLKVTLVKAPHEVELTKSVLVHVTTPSDAVEVLRSYSVAHRSRRTTLARLAEKYTNLLFMEPLSEGGYILKCAGLLEVCWMLQNKWSPISPFHHRMRFDLEYMDESYIKIITQYHRQLSDPAIETDERTALLCKIINTCLEAKGPTQELYESMESDPETAQTLRKRRTTLDQEVTETALKRKRDDNIMAPPKSVPKKRKGKENVDRAASSVNDAEARKDNVDRAGSGGSVNDGKAGSSSSNKDGRVTAGNSVISENFDNNGGASVSKTKDVKKKTVKTAKEVVGAKTGQENDKDNVVDAKSKDKRDVMAKSTKNKALDGKNSEVDMNMGEEGSSKGGNGVAISKKISKANDLGAGGSKDKNPVVSKKISGKNVEGTKEVAVVSKKVTADKNNEEGKKENAAKLTKKSVVPKIKDNANKEANIARGQKDKETNLEKTTKNNDKIEPSKEKTSKTKVNANMNKNVDANNLNNKVMPNKVKKTDDIANIPSKKAKIDNTAKNAPNTNPKTVQNPKKSITNTNKQVVKNIQKTSNPKIVNSKGKDDLTKKDTTFTKTTETVKKVTEKNTISSTKAHIAERADIDTNNDKNNDNIPKKNNFNAKKAINNQDKAKIVKGNIENNKNVHNDRINPKSHTGNTNKKLINSNTNVKKPTGNILKETESKISKIPQKSSIGSVMKKNPLRISPRKLAKNIGSIQAMKTFQKPVTNIPRLLKKPAVKP